MPKLISDEVQIAVARGAHRDQSNHLMKRDSPVDNEALIACSHLPVHLLIGEPEDNCLIANERLVMGFSVADGSLINPSTRKLSPHL